MISPSSIEQRVDRCWLRTCRPDPVEVQVSEATGSHPLRGIGLRHKREPAKEAPGDAALRVTAALVPAAPPSAPSPTGATDCPASSALLGRDPGNLGAMSERSIPVGGVGILRLCLPPLPWGEHKVVLVVDAWGIAAEQTKNFLENVKTYTAGTEAK